MIRKLLFSSLLASGSLFFAQSASGFDAPSTSSSRWVIIPSLGYGWRTASVATNLSKDSQDYINKLKSGMTFDLAAFYTIKNNWGLGIKYSQFNTSADGHITVRDELSGNATSGYINTKDQIRFIGAAFIYNNFDEATKHKLYYDLALGVISYSSKTGSVELTGSNFGLDADIAYQYALTNQIFVGPKVGYTVGTLTKAKINGHELNLNDQKEGLGRVNLSVSATFRF